MYLLAYLPIASPSSNYFRQACICFATRVKAPQTRFRRLAGYSNLSVTAISFLWYFFRLAVVFYGHIIVVEGFRSTVFPAILDASPASRHTCVAKSGGQHRRAMSAVRNSARCKQQRIIFFLSLCVLIKLVLLFCLSECCGL